MEPDTSLARPAVPETGKCLKAQPEDLLFVAPAATSSSLLHHSTHTKQISDHFLLFIFLSKNKTKFQMDVSGIPEEQLNEFCFTYFTLAAQ